MTNDISPDRDRARLAALLDKHEIYEVLARYARAADRCDEALLRSVFHPGAAESHSGIHAGSAESFCDLALDLLRGMGRTAHYIFFPTVELDGDIAHSEAYAIGFHRVEHEGTPYDSIFGARILDRFERRDGAWKVAERRVVYDWNRDTPTRENWGMGVFGSGVYADAAKDRTDPLYTFWPVPPR